MKEKLIGYWTVQAGRVAGEPSPGKVRQFNYTSQMQREDSEKEDPLETHFYRLRDEVMQFAKEISDPSEIKWLRVEYLKV